MARISKKTSIQSRRFVRVGVWVVGVIGFLFVSSVVGVTWYGKNVMTHHEESVVAQELPHVEKLPQFPVGVNPKGKEITELPEAVAFYSEHIAPTPDVTSAHTSWLGRALGKLALMGWYQNLASVSSRILVIQAGERKEQVADNFKKILAWTDDERDEFLRMIESEAPLLSEGKFFPGTYTVPRKAKPDVVAPLVLERFNTEVLAFYGDDVAEVVPLEQALIIASLLEREAYDYTDMRHISGVIWNRLFTDMRLQLDATLQYAKGSSPKQAWWPKVVPADKYLASAYNTYKNEGLPPAAIANPSPEAILAALNPSKTECMYYFHDKKAGFHCSKTYEEHVALLKKIYGRGK